MIEEKLSEYKLIPVTEREKDFKILREAMRDKIIRVFGVSLSSLNTVSYKKRVLR